MEIKSRRMYQGDNTTLSRLLVNDRQYGWVLEDIDRGLVQTMPLEEIQRIKVPARTAIPAGRYRVDITWSNRFKRKMMILIGVPGFAGIRVHPGNKHVNTEGCLLPGLKYGAESGDYIVGESIKACNPLHDLVAECLAKGESVYWTIERAYA